MGALEPTLANRTVIILSLRNKRCTQIVEHCDTEKYADDRELCLHNGGSNRLYSTW